MENIAENKSSPGNNSAIASDTKNSGERILTPKFISELLVILLLSAVTYGVWALFWTKFSRAEVFFAECAREMIATNNLITPLYHAQPFFDKPIFVYWLIIAMFKTFGINHFAARLPSIVASLVTIAVTALSGAFLFNKRSGLLAAFMLASSFMYMSFSSLCMSDMFLVMFDACSLAAIYAGIIWQKKRTSCWVLAALSMGFAFLTKGPVGIVLPVLSAIIFLALTQKLNAIKVKHVVLGFLIMAVVASPWFYAAYLANGPQSMVHFFIQENLQRFAGSTYDVHKPFWYTIFSFFLGFAPWSIFIPFACWSFYKGFSQEKYKISIENNFALSGQLYLWIWIIVSVGFFCFSRGKCDYYTMPSFTAAAILVAYYVQNLSGGLAMAAQALAMTFLMSVSIFAVVVLPKINAFVPIVRYVEIIKNSPANVRVGVDEKAASWIDEILFQSGNDPQRICSSEEFSSFINKGGPILLILPEHKYKVLSPEEKSNYQIISVNRVSTHPLTPGYLIGRKGNIADDELLLVIANFPTSGQ